MQQVGIKYYVYNAVALKENIIKYSFVLFDFSGASAQQLRKATVSFAASVRFAWKRATCTGQIFFCGNSVIGIFTKIFYKFRILLQPDKITDTFYEDLSTIVTSRHNWYSLLRLFCAA